VGGGEFSSPVTVSLREPLETGSGPSVVAITVTVIVVIIVVLSFTALNLLAYIFWKRHNTVTGKQVWSDEDADYEVPADISLPSAPPLTLQHNAAYGKIPAPIEMTENECYSAVTN
jgi:hypothetical protein